MEIVTQENDIFVGRKEEIALFKKCFEAILPENQGKEEYKDCPRILSFWGESGVGKTRLVEEFWQTAIDINYEIKSFKNLSKDIISLEDFITEDTNTNHYQFTQTENQLNTLLDNLRFGLIIIDNFSKLESVWSYFSIYYRRTAYHNFNMLWVLLDTDVDNLIYGNPPFKYYQQELKPFSFSESKTFLNGFFSQFSDEYLQKIYAYTKGKPEQLQFLVNLVKDKKIPAEAVLNELIRNEGKILSDLKFALEESENLEHKVIAVMTHNLNNKFGGLRNDFDSLKKIVERGIKDDLADEVLNNFYRKLDEATNTFNNTYRILEKRNIAPQKTNIFEFLNELKTDYIKKSFFIEVNTENPEIEAEIDRGALKDAFQNLINNAEKHGFKDDTKTYKIIFSLSEFNKEGIEFIRILYQNNGKSFSKGFSFDDYRRLAGKSANSTGAGIGGYWIKKVIDLHKGEWNALNLHDSSLYFPIEMEFILPQKQSSV